MQRVSVVDRVDCLQEIIETLWAAAQVPDQDAKGNQDDCPGRGFGHICENAELPSCGPASEDL